MSYSMSYSTALMLAPGASGAAVPTSSKSTDLMYATAPSDCTAGCPAEVAASFNKPALLCGMIEMSDCLDNCRKLTTSWMATVCACQLLPSEGAAPDFFGKNVEERTAQTYCCGDPHCKSALVGLYVNVFGGKKGRVEIEDMVHGTCIDVRCGEKSAAALEAGARA
jgi:hypothetical protein